MAGQLRAPLVVTEALAEATASLRAPLVTIEASSEGAPRLRGSLVTIDALSEGNRNLRVALMFIEALVPVPPEGHVSTELFPGSLGSPTALPGLAFVIHKRPRFSTAVYPGSSGVSVRRAMMQYPIWEFELTFEFLRDNDAINSNEYRTLCGFFLSRQGGFDTFLLKDPDDYQVTGGSLGTGDGTTTQFPFLRSFGGFEELVGQVDNGNPIHIYDNGVLKTLGTDYTIALPNQLIFTVAPAAGHAITADFQFFFNCRFQEDVADFDKFADKFWELQKIVLETVIQ